MVQKKRSTLFILAGIALILFAVYSLKNAGNTGVASKLEQQLDQALKGDSRHLFSCTPSTVLPARR